MQLLLFNPENDLALANGDPNFVAPASARKLASDLALLPMWWKESKDLLFTSDMSVENSLISGCVPWGWSREVCNRFLKGGVDAALLPTLEQLARIRELSHRRTSITILTKLKEAGLLSSLLEVPREVCSLEEAEAYIAAHPQGAILKTPWSSSGKGLCWSARMNEYNRKHWLKPVFRKMGSVIGEPCYNRIVDFAMLFKADKGEGVQFVGYSLFEADEQGAYVGNRLLSNEAILDELSSYIAIEQLEKVCCALQTILSSLLTSVYEGYLGVDMMIVENRGENGFLLHPCVELNLRMTMGGVARLLFDRHIKRGEGVFKILYSSNKGELLLRLPEFRSQENGAHFSGGTVCLTPVNEETQYAAVVEMKV